MSQAMLICFLHPYPFMKETHPELRKLFLPSRWVDSQWFPRHSLKSPSPIKGGHLDYATNQSPAGWSSETSRKSVWLIPPPAKVHLCSFPVHPLGLLGPIHRKRWTPYAHSLTAIKKTNCQSKHHLHSWKTNFLKTVHYNQCWGKILLKVMHYNIALLPKKVTNYVTFYGK